MNGRRSFGAGMLRRLRKILQSLQARIAALFLIASLPLLSLLTIWRHDQESLLIIGLAVAAGMAVLVGGFDIAVTAPIRHMGRSIDGWRAGGGFTAHRAGVLPGELRRLALSFKRSTLALNRREAELRRAVQQQELAMQEIHHRVKNNLQIVASLLNLQASRIRSPAARAEFQAARDRVRALATLHRHLYAHGEVHTINMRSFLVELCGQLFQAMGETEGQRLSLQIEAAELQISSDQAVPLALIVTEAVTNAVKYAFPAGRRGTISVRLTDDGETVDLAIQDDGIGIPSGRVETEAGTRDGIGIQLINGFARQLGGTLEVQQGEGTLYHVRTKLHRQRLASPALGAARPG